MIWDYKIVQHWSTSNLEGNMQGLGKEGWEAFFVEKDKSDGYLRIYYKRLLVDDITPKIL